MQAVGPTVHCSVGVTNHLQQMNVEEVEQQPTTLRHLLHRSTQFNLNKFNLNKFNKFNKFNLNKVNGFQDKKLAGGVPLALAAHLFHQNLCEDPV